MERAAFLLKVRKDRLEEYKKKHREVWPEMLDALRRHGWRNYSLFLDDDGQLFGYAELEESIEKSLEGMAGEDVNLRWQEFMSEYFESLSGRPDSRWSSWSTSSTSNEQICRGQGQGRTVPARADSRRRQLRRPEQGVVEYYKVPAALMVCGMSAAAGGLLSWIRRHGFHENGDFGPRPQEERDSYYYTTTTHG